MSPGTHVIRNQNTRKIRAKTVTAMINNFSISAKRCKNIELNFVDEPATKKTKKYLDWYNTKRQ